MHRSEVDIKKLTPMMRQYLDIKNKHEDVIIFFRLGDFYEMFFEDAIKVAKLLDIALTSRSCGLKERIPMAGVPHHSANIYINKLVELGHKVGICEQLEDPKDVKGIVKRGLVQIVSSGTLMDVDSLKSSDFNYIGSIVLCNEYYIITYADITTGEINVQKTVNNKVNLINEIINLNLKELVVSPSVDNSIFSILQNQFNIGITIYDYKTFNKYNYVYSELEPIYIKGIKHLISYLDETKFRDLSHLQKAIIKNESDFLKMDVHTKRNLELVEVLRTKERTHSLIWLLNKTKTAMGSRLLKKYIENPLTDKVKIEQRLNYVQILINEFILKANLQVALQEVYDLERLSGKIAFGNCNARDLIQLRNSLKVLPDISNILKKINYYKKLDILEDLYNLLVKSISETPPIGLKEGSLIKVGYNKELDELKELRKGGKDFLAKFEHEERIRTGIKNLKIGYNKVFGYYIEITKGNLGLVNDSFGYERKQTLANCERYISPILKEKEALILNAEEKIVDLEYELFINIRNKVRKYIPNIQKVANVLSEIDVLQSFSKIAEENNYVRPEFTENEIEIKDNRHPVLELVINDFVSNDIIMDKKTNILLITGPNMAGKSTYIRQLAITVIMAQIGSFVPASKALIPLFDAIFTRIGASDDLISGESTFMVEMNEANRAISEATSNSLILFDELGRGTATFDGIALAQAIIEYIHNEIGCPTLFSTHYHELTDLELNLKHLKNIHVSAYEENGELVFLHKVKEGSVDKSYGINVAKIANLPKGLISRAKEILTIYEQTEIKREELIPPVYKEKKSKVLEEVQKMNVLEISPMEAINLLYKLKEMSKEE